jgi:hypothetical protein
MVDRAGATERAEVEHWRTTAIERAEALEQLRHRPLVRAALALDRRLEPARAKAAVLARRARTSFDHGVLAAAAWRERSDLPQRRAALTSVLASLPEPPAEGFARSVHTKVCALTGQDLEGNWNQAAELAREAEGSDADYLCFLPSAIEVVDEHWLTRVCAVLGDGVVAATPQLIHPERAPRDATEHDGLTRGIGIALERDFGTVVPVACDAGEHVRSGDVVDVAGAPAVALVVDRLAYERVGGLLPLDDVDAAAFELCTRLRRAGGRIVAVPDAIVTDARPVPSRRALTHPIATDTASWRHIIGAHGPWLYRNAPGPPITRRHWAITVAAPSRKVAHRWGDWHLAHALAASLEREGESVDVRTADEADDPESRCADVHLVLRGLAPVARTPGQRHVLWILSHPEAIDIDECDAADLVVVASPRFAAHLRTRTDTPVEVLLQATDHHRFRPVAPEPEHQHPVTVVAKTRNVMRPAVAMALAAGIRPAIYGGGWDGLVDPALVVADHVDNDRLPVVYSSAGVVLNDHWGTMRAWGFVSNRLFDVLACGTPIVSDGFPEIEAIFGDTVPTYCSSDELADHVRAALDHPDEARAVADRGRQLVLEGHTFDHRAGELLALLTRHGVKSPE